MKYFLLALTLSTSAFAAEFREYPIGDAVEKKGLKIAAVYFPAVAMDHSTLGGAHAKHGVTGTEVAKEKFVQIGKELVHLEADIHALVGNTNGFGAGEWIPYLPIKFKLSQLDDKGAPKAVSEGELMPMVAKDGPHYGTTLRMTGVSKYRLEYEIGAPALARHSDPLTGVAEYWTTFTVTFDFDYRGIAK